MLTDGARPLRPLWFWLAALAAVGAGLWLFRAVLLPFLAGMAIAYFLDPLVDRLERLRIGRTLGTLVAIVGFFSLAVLVVLLFVPIVQEQAARLVSTAPGYLEALRAWAEARWMEAQLEAGVAPEALRPLTQAAQPEQIGEALRWIGQLLGEVLTGGLAVFNLLSLIFITPVVAFYLLRDWDRMTAQIHALLPRGQLAVIEAQMAEIDRTLAGFARGQILLCLTLGAFYAIGLTLAGLDFGIVIGVLSGLIAFIPYVGTAVGGVLSVGLAFAQFDDPARVAIVAGVFVAGQMLEGNVLQPLLVGDRVGLHPVWVIFALLAGGSLLGFVGVLVAVPVAAVLGVLIRFAVQLYRRSHLYGDP